MKKVFFILLFFVPAFLASEAYAGNEKFNARISGSSVLQYAKVTVKDDKYDFMDTHKTGPGNWKTSFTNKKITNTVTLSVDPYSLTMADPYEISAELQFQYQKWDDATSKFVLYTTPSNQTLTINYAATGTSTYKDKSVYTFEGGNLLTVKIVNITRTVNGVTTTAVDFPVYLEAEVAVERYYAFNAASAPVLAHSDQTSGSGEVEVTWNFLDGAEEYDLEWTYVNDFDDAGTPLPQSLVVFEPNVFRFNSSRISTTNNFYRIPVIYEQGYLLFRVRGVGRSSADNYTKNLYSQWSVASDTYTNVAQFPDAAKFQIVSGHQKNLNWQYNISYAEEGKSKVVVSYFDGSLRNRQAVTRMNTKSDQVIVGETIYDHQGRPAVQVLPVPFGSSVIEYKPDFNKNADNKPYTKTDFDYDASCEVQAAPLNKVSGASNYYSENNSLSGASPYIPNANGYPFTQTQYTPDNTGRIKAQSGVGDTHKIGSDHETKYYYGKPTSQVELDRLFGSEVGDVMHYKKNMVVDPNGQVSVSYLDPQGRVVATALAGATPSNLVDLGATPVPMKADFLNKLDPVNQSEPSANQQVDGSSKTYTQELLVTTADDRDFNYKIVPERFQDACEVVGVTGGETTSVTKNICYNCVLDLQIRLTDECGTDFLVNLDDTDPNSTTTTIGKAIITQINAGNYTIDGFDPSVCSTPATFKIGTASEGAAYTSSPLHIGNYTISKVLTVNEQALEFYLENYMKKNECLLQLNDFLTDELSHLDTLGCNQTCDQCLNELGSFDKYNVDINPDCNPCMTASEYANALANCNALCNSTAVDCQAGYQMMMNDMAPMGQYGDILDAMGNVNPSGFPLSMFNVHNVHNPKARNFDGNYHPDWKHPMYKDKDGVLKKGYLESDGSPALVRIYPQVTGGYSPAIDDDAVIVTIDDDQYVAPEDLKNVYDAIFVWKKSWSASLVLHHPEYMMYEFCMVEEQSHLFDETWLQKNTLSAVPSTYWEPLGVDMDHALDPYFNDNKNELLLQKDYDYMKYSMNNYASVLGHNITMLQMAYATNHCPNQGSTSCSASTMCNNVDLSLITPSTVLSYFTNDDWITFRMYYYSLKQRVYNKARTKFAVYHTSYNGCIGAKGYFRWYNNDFFATPYNKVEEDYGLFGHSIYYRYGRSQFLNLAQACSYATYGYYRDKIKRFDDPLDNPPNTGANASVCYNEISEGEYEEINCPAKNTAAIQLTQDKNAFDYYQMCGECPITKSLEVLLNAVVKSPVYEPTNDFQLSCYPESKFPEYTQSLEDAMHFESTSSGPVSWNTSSINTDELLNVSIQRSGATSCNLKLQLSESGYPIDDYSNGTKNLHTDFDWSEIKSICCVSTFDSPTLLPYEPGKHFLASALVSVTDADGKKRDEKISIEGKSCINLADCPAPVICTPTPAAATLENLLNQLMFRAPATNPSANDEITQNFVTTNDVALDVDHGVFDDTFIGQLKDMTAMTEAARFKWSGTDLGVGHFTGLLKGVGSNNTETGQCLLTLEVDGAFPGTASFDDILEINSLMPDKTTCANGTTSNFVCYALVAYTESGVPKKKYVVLKGYMPCTILGLCITAQKPTVSN